MQNIFILTHLHFRKIYLHIALCKLSLQNANHYFAKNLFVVFVYRVFSVFGTNFLRNNGSRFAKIIYKARCEDIYYENEDAGG